MNDHQKPTPGPADCVGQQEVKDSRPIINERNVNAANMIMNGCSGNAPRPDPGFREVIVPAGTQSMRVENPFGHLADAAFWYEGRRTRTVADIEITASAIDIRISGGLQRHGLLIIKR